MSVVVLTVTGNVPPRDISQFPRRILSAAAARYDEFGGIRWMGISVTAAPGMVATAVTKSRRRKITVTQAATSASRFQRWPEAAI